jgi:hypothetical protein
MPKGAKEELLMKRPVAVAALAALTLSYTAPGFAQSSTDLKALNKEVQALKEGQKAIQQDLQGIKTLLRARPAAAPVVPQNVVLSVDGAPFKGEKTAKLTLIEFTDFQ